MAEELGIVAVRPDYSLAQFAKTHLAQGCEWEEFLRIQSASPPQTLHRWERGELVHYLEPASAEYSRRCVLHEELVERFHSALRSGLWIVKAISSGNSDRASVATDLVLTATEIDFFSNRIGSFRLVQILPLPGEDRYLTLKWFIEQVCAVVPPKRGVGRKEVLELAERLLQFEIRDDLFKAAWADANKPEGFGRPGPSTQFR
ncbi:hypothetical protein [Qipengyuania sediminis]|uniref:hypothetical protein n=1 Tax=Qipengyuania sediminis TaxID=1532023 RepID=UPI0010598DC1|nr:hypothetical protein [Qipengyuania sediminis]